MTLENRLVSENICELTTLYSGANPIQNIHKISQAITDEKYIEDVLHLILTVTATITRIATCSLWLVDKRENPWRLCLKSSQGINADLFQHRSLALNQGVVGRVATKKRPAIIANVQKDRQFKEKNMAQKLGIVSMLSVPMVYKKETLLGVLNCFTTHAHVFSESEVCLMNRVADQAAVTIFNTERMVRAGLAKEELDTQDLLIRASKVLMGQRKLSADDAASWIQDCSHTSCRSLRHVAEAILLVTPMA